MEKSLGKSKLKKDINELNEQPAIVREGSTITPPVFDTFDKYGQICTICGRDVSWGSGYFINRVHEFNNLITRINIGRQFPLGNFVCQDCDEMEE
jgi:hypothetical protein